MKCEVDGNIVDIKTVSYRERGFGRSAVGYSIVPYKLIVHRDELLSAFGVYYTEYGIDDQQFRSETDETDLRLRELEWPPLNLLMDNYPQVLEEFLTKNTALDAIQELFKNQDPQHLRFWINSVSRVKLVDDSIVFSGEILVSNSTQMQ